MRSNSVVVDARMGGNGSLFSLVVGTERRVPDHARRITTRIGEEVFFFLTSLLVLLRDIAIALKFSCRRRYSIVDVRSSVSLATVLPK